MKHVFYCEPHPQSWGGLIQLTEDYKRQDVERCLRSVWLPYRNEIFRQLRWANVRLQCYLCGREGLDPFPESDKSPSLATLDHIIPRCDAPAKSFDIANLAVACTRCNQHRGNKPLLFEVPDA